MQTKIIEADVPADLIEMIKSYRTIKRQINLERRLTKRPRIEIINEKFAGLKKDLENDLLYCGKVTQLFPDNKKLQIRNDLLKKEIHNLLEYYVK